MTIPGAGLETEMAGRGELAGTGAEPADDQEDRADDDMEAVEPGRHVEGRGIDAVAEPELGMGVLIALEEGETHAEEDGGAERHQRFLAVADLKGVVRPGDRGP